MASKPSRFGRIIKGYLFAVGMTEKELSAKIGLCLNKLSAALHGKYHLSREHLDLTLAVLADRGVHLHDEACDELLDAWSESGPPQRPIKLEPACRLPRRRAEAVR